MSDDRKRKRRDWMYNDESSTSREQETRFTSGFSSRGESRDSKSEGWDSFIPSFVKRTLGGGEERERGDTGSRDGGWFRGMGLPGEIAKEIARLTAAQAERAKQEVTRTITREVKQFFDNLDVWEEIPKILEQMTVDVELKMRFRRETEDGGSIVSPEINWSHQRKGKPQRDKGDETEITEE